MSDIALEWNADAGAADFVVGANDLLKDDGLETSVLLSLFTDRRAEDTDVLPDGENDRRGWWADAHPDVDGDQIGSRLWLIARSKESPETLRRAEEYAREALQWLVDDLVASRVDVTASIPSRGVLQLAVTIHRPSTDATNFRFNYTWAAQEARSA